VLPAVVTIQALLLNQANKKMADIYQWYGDDFQVDVNGDLLLVSGATWTQQRIVRRLLTPPNTYLFHPEYGAGLGRFIGENLSPDLFQEIKNICVTQILLETAVAKNPKPIVALSIQTILENTVLNVAIEYYDLELQQTVYLSFNVDKT
jgi:hypothetical protein